MNADVTRRSFMLSAATAASAARVARANDRIRLGIIGTGGRGMHLVRMANLAGGIEWIAVCDAWDERREEAVKKLDRPVEKYADYRKLLDRTDIDAVIIATLDHLHAPMTIDACRAGKDVFVEKPMTSQPMQGVELVRVVGETKRVVQVGVQQRSLAHFIEAKQKFFDSGLMGQVGLARTIWNYNRGYLSPVPPGMDEKPAGLDWEAVLGWLPKRSWDPKRYFNRFAYWDFATGGQTGGLFVHLVDVVHWYLNIRKPVSAVALGGIYRYDDGRDTPDVINLVLDYPEKVNVTFEATLLDAKEEADIIFIGTGGRLYIFRYGYRYIPSEENKAVGEIAAAGTPEPPHMANWLDCIRTRKEPNANVVDGHYSAMACHIGNIAYKEKARVVWRKEWDV